MGRPLKTAKNNAAVDYGYASATSGVVGGSTAQSGYQVLARVKIGSQTEADGYIIRQKGKNKFLVGSVTNIQDEDIVANNSYVITSLSNTDWTYFGVNGAVVGSIFTAPIDGTGLSTNGVVNLVGVCTLANTANSSLASNTMTVECTKADATQFKAKTLSNTHTSDFSNNKYITTFGSANASTQPYATVTVASS